MYIVIDMFMLEEEKRYSEKGVKMWETEKKGRGRLGDRKTKYSRDSISKRKLYIATRFTNNSNHLHQVSTVLLPLEPWNASHCEEEQREIQFIAQRLYSQH